MRRVRDLQPYIGRELRRRSSGWTRTATTLFFPAAPGFRQSQSEIPRPLHDTLQKGRVREGVVSSIVNFGAFVDLLMALTGSCTSPSCLGSTSTTRPRLSKWVPGHGGHRRRHGSRARIPLAEGRRKIRGRPSPALTASAGTVPGRVTKLVPFGAFVRVEDGIEVSSTSPELAQRHIDLPEQVAKVGDEVFVKVIDSIDLERRRISSRSSRPMRAWIRTRRTSIRRCTA